MRSVTLIAKSHRLGVLHNKLNCDNFPMHFRSHDYGSKLAGVTWEIGNDLSVGSMAKGSRHKPNLTFLISTYNK